MIILWTDSPVPVERAHGGLMRRHEPDAAVHQTDFDEPRGGLYLAGDGRVVRGDDSQVFGNAEQFVDEFRGRNLSEGCR